MAGNLFKYGTCKAHTNIRAKINSFISLGDLGDNEGLEQGRDLPLNAIRNFVFSFSTALFSPFFDLFSKWQVEGKVLKLQRLFIFRLQMICKLSSLQSISARVFESHSLCRLCATNLRLTVSVKKVEFLRVRISLEILQCCLYYF